MVKFDADPTDPPGVNTSDVSGTVINWATYVLILGMAVAAFSVAQATISPTVAGLAENIPGVDSGGESGELRVV